jgi:hypothetical protein
VRCRTISSISFFFVKVENKKKGIKKSFDYSGRDYDRE